MKISNFFTALRIALAPVFLVIFFMPTWFNFGQVASVYILIPLFVFMEFTDFLDGFFARKKNEVSDFGKNFDPFADVLANITAMFCFVLSGNMHPLFFLVILYREFGITFIRMLASKKGVAIGAKMSGKVKTVLYIVAIGFSLLIESVDRLSLDGLFNASVLKGMNVFSICLYGIATIASVYSFLVYINDYKSLLKSS